jgi:hypothetical protein
MCRVILRPDTLVCVDVYSTVCRRYPCIISIAQNIQHDVGSREFARSVLLVFAAALVFFMQAGFAMVRLYNS